MSSGSPEPDIGEALATIRRFLSDEIPPLTAAEAVLAAVREPPELVASEIRRWIASQGGRANRELRVCDLTFHALKKLNETAELKLVPAELLEPFLGRLKVIVLEFCPAGEQRELHGMLDGLERSPTALERTIDFVRRPVGPGSTDSAGVPEGIAEGTQAYAADVRRERRFAMMLDRLQKSAPGPAPAAGTAGAQQTSEALALAAAEARSGTELAQIQAALAQNSAGSGTHEFFRLLSQSLPGWVVPATGEEQGKTATLPTHNTAVLAMRQIMRLTRTRNEGWQRFQEMVQAAIEQFNDGSLARAVTMLELSSSLIADGTVDARAVDGVRRSAHDALELNRLRRYAEQPAKHRLLRRALAFFAEFEPETLLDHLQNEPKRDRRRLILNLLEALGAPARAAAFERLCSIAHSPEIPTQWYFARNLVCILGRVPRTDESGPEQEISLVGTLMNLAYPAPLIREAISLLGQLKHEDSERLLVAAVQQVENRLRQHDVGGLEAGKLKSLLDRLTYVIARYGSARAITTVVNHGLKRDEQLGDTLARLSSLSGQDLSADPEGVGRLLQALRAKTPRRLLGLTIQKDVPGLLHIVKALSSTPAPAVQEAFRQIVTRFPDEEFGKVAQYALQGFHSGQHAVSAADRLFGDLELFGLPELLQQLVRTRLSGSLTLKDENDEVVGCITLDAGRMRSCRAGKREGKAALCSLLVTPIPGTFSFTGRKPQVEPGTAEPAAQGEDLLPLIIEGMQRHDELQRARTLVPDGSHLCPTGEDPVPRPDEDDPQLLQRLWKRASGGAPPEECEKDPQADDSQIRLLLARWVEEGNLHIR